MKISRVRGSSGVSRPVENARQNAEIWYCRLHEAHTESGAYRMLAHAGENLSPSQGRFRLRTNKGIWRCCEVQELLAQTKTAAVLQ